MLEKCGGPEKTDFLHIYNWLNGSDFLQFLLWEGVVVLKESDIFRVSIFVRVVVALKELIF